jgi:hypothetical protein
VCVSAAPDTYFERFIDRFTLAIRSIIGDRDLDELVLFRDFNQADSQDFRHHDRLARSILLAPAQTFDLISQFHPDPASELTDIEVVDAP